MHARPFFLDTNVLVYAYTSQSDAKSEVANALITIGEAMISAQVLNEFCNTIRRKFPNLYPQLERAVDELVTALPVAPLTLATTRSAVHLSQRYGWSC
jgi:predicted nucleic acid-binding protein